MRTSPLTSYLFAVLCIATLTFSCTPDHSLSPSDDGFVADVETHLSFTENLTDGMPDRVTAFNTALILGDTSLGRSEPGDDAIWVHVADIASTTLDGEQLSATQVVFAAGRAYVSYHVRGPVYKGLVEVIDLGNPKVPKVIGQAFFLHADVNAIGVEKEAQGDKRKVWLALADEKKGGILAELEMKNNVFNPNYYRQTELEPFLAGDKSTASANGVVEAGDLIYITSGRTNGGVFGFKKSSMDFVGVREFSNAKAVASNGNEEGLSVVAALSAGDNATLYLNNVGTADFTAEIPLGMSISHKNVDDPLGGKFTLAFGGDGSNLLHVAAGDKGIVVIDITTGEKRYTSPDDMLPDGNCNAVHLDNQFLYAANGADGIAICSLDGEGLPNEEHVFLWDLDEPGASANFVQTDGDWVFIAKGEGGIKILKKPHPGDLLPLCGFDADGAPTCQIAKPACDGLMDVVNLTLPVNAKQPVLHPEWFTGGAHEILLEEDAGLEVTFVDENTNQKHALGYYFYNQDSPPASSSELVGLIVFPNFSKSGSGGSLVAGYTMPLHGVMEAGTKVGFFLVKKGWNGSELSFGQGMLFTNPAYNPNPHKQGLLMYDADCDIYLGAFEHNPLPSANADFREAVFSVKVSPATAVDAHEFIQF